MLSSPLLPAIRDVLAEIRHARRIEDVVRLILEKACSLADASHGSFALVDHEAGRLTITQVCGAGWTPEKQLCQLAIGEGLTGWVAQTGSPLLCPDTAKAADYYPLFDYVRSELVVPVVVRGRVWGVINIDGPTPHAFDQTTLDLLTVFAELTAFAITLRQDHAEQEKLNQKLLQSEKLASLGEALAGIAHEVNNPLTAVLAHASLLKLDVSHASVPVIMSEAQRAADLIRNVLEFSHRETDQHQLIDLSDLVSKTVALRKFQLKTGGVTLEAALPDQPCPVLANPQQVRQVLLNLILNAEQAIPANRHDGRITIAVRATGGRALVTVRDNGVGIPPEARRYVFDPFFTTKAPGEGTGLGLSIAHTVAEAHGGALHLSETSSAGTRFTLELPLAPPPKTSEPPAAPPRAARLRGRALLVDDELQIIKPLSAYLGSLNVEVRHALSGEAALEALKAESFDVIVSDLRMPGMDGPELYAAACVVDPAYAHRFVFMSGYLARESATSFLRTLGVPCLEKPFSLDELRRVVSPFLKTMPSPPEVTPRVTSATSRGAYATATVEPASAS